MKRQISVLDQSTIDKIAAGEVVERPASVVKELVENAIDAGASAVTVEIKGGGISFIRITDNGSGIARDQVPLAFLRHATSKIRQVEDLASISSLGFRGEALSSIAAVSQVELITKPHEDLMGTRYVIEGGREKGLEDVGAPDGTTFLVRNLFYNTPARAKFLKTPATESGYISSFIEQLALSHPYISFKYIQDGKTKLHTSGNDNLREVIYQVYGREITRELIEIHDVSPDGEMEISGFIGKPTVNRGNRNFENYYVNGRYVKSKVLMKAIEDAYHTYTMQHKYPFTALVIQIRGDDVDINVHPTKMEVRFSRQEEVYRQVFQTIRQALQQKELIPEVSVSDDSSKSSGQKEPPEKKAPHANGAEPFEIHRRQMEAAARGRNVNLPFSRTSRTGGTDRMPDADLRSSRSDAAVPGSPLHTEMEKAPIVSGREPAAKGNVPAADGANQMTVENTHAASAPNQAMLENTQAALGLNQVTAGNAQAGSAPNQAEPENMRTAPGTNQAVEEKTPTTGAGGSSPAQPETTGE
ncbi:MAG TPA: DNA mismatch repair endonuclease MutL, partial [Candidatus Pullilachnospira stercoravium]|nr:DNA mismatch repair endonuclease MutL [Candidatus Pullilachnospira stercoravium]